MKITSAHEIKVLRPKHPMRFQEILSGFGAKAAPTSRQQRRRREFEAEFARVSGKDLPRSERRTIARDALDLKRQAANPTKRKTAKAAA
jgi:hypothetical protein